VAHLEAAQECARYSRTMEEHKGMIYATHSLIDWYSNSLFFSLRTMNCKDNNGQAILKLMWLFSQVFFQKFYIISHISIYNHKTPYWQILLKSG